MAKFVLYEEASAPALIPDAVVVYSLSTDVNDNMLYAKSPNGVRVLGNFPNVDATHDIGSSSYKWRDGYFSRNVTVGGTFAATGAVTLAAGLTVSAGGLAVAGNSAITGSLTVSSGLTVSAGGAAITGNTAVTGTLTVSSTLTVSGAATLPGLTVNQAVQATKTSFLTGTTVAHGMTGLAPTDRYYDIGQGVLGGVLIGGYGSSGVPVFRWSAYATAEDVTNKNASANGYYSFTTFMKSGTSATNPTANANLLTINYGSSTRFLFDAEGDFYYDGSTNVYDAYDDLALVRGLDLLSPGAIRTRFDDWVTTKKDDLVAAGILGADGPNGERGLVNLTGISRLHNGALWQLAMRVMQLEEKLALVAGA